MIRTRNVAVFAFLLLGMPAVAAASDAGTGSASMTHRMMILAIQLGAVLFAAKLGDILFTKLRLPGVLGELVAGMLIGPYALGQLGFFGFEQGLFPLAGGHATSPELYGIASVAAIVLMFTAGLETDLALLLRYVVAGGLAGLGGVVASFFAGATVAVAASHMLGGPAIGLFDPPALFLGTITTATSVGLTARILSEERKLESPEGVTILSAAVIDDVIGIILLAVVIGIIKVRGAGGEFNWSAVGITSARAVGVWIVATVLGIAASRRISVLLKWFGGRTTIAVMALGLALILAGLFEEAGLAMIVGAFVMGLSLSRADVKHVVTEKLRPVYALLVPVFFCVTGMQINLGELASPTVLLIGLLYAVAAMAAKVFGCGLPVLLVNFNLRGAARVGFGMAPRCEVALIIAGIGLGIGVVSQEIFAAVIMMVLINAVVATPVLVALLRRGGPGTRTEPAETDRALTSVPFQFASDVMAEFVGAKAREAFEADGFFVHRISHDPPIHQFRSDGTVIDMRQSSGTLTFHCKRSDVSMVNAAILEAVAALEGAVRQLRKPLDTGAIAGRLSETISGDAQTPSLAAVLAVEQIAPDLKATNKQEVIDELLDLMVRCDLVKDREAAADAIWQRERSLSTGLTQGVAIPHGKTDAVDRLVAVVGVHRGGIDFEATDGQRSQIFIMTLSPASKPSPHIRFMSDVSRVLEGAGRKRVLACGGREELFEVLCGRPTRSGSSAFRLADHLTPAALVPNLSGDTPEAVIDELIEALDRAGALRLVNAARRAVHAREAEMHTGLSDGVAIPHGRTVAVRRLVCAAGIHRTGVDFEAADGEPAHIIVLVLTPTQGANPYIQFVSALVKRLTPEGRAKILAAQTPEQLYQALTGEQPPE